ncbi:AzlD domain-containing protein [Sabulicella glaciei]|uniref:AzlD domain-containing protein n=1 Tax=Sabulicella glaciei TaxID=2984948 RepID=A0ABT3NV26_9PROT|nr:AzlD domain-containing protein [Roseococcus sp. MDT2-1-1]
MTELLLLIGACAALRAAGLAVAGRMGPEHPFIRWASSVAMATLAAFVASALLLPSGALATLPLAARLGGMGAAVAVLFWRGGLLLPVLVGLGVAVLLNL